MEETRLQDVSKCNRLVRFGAFELCLDTRELKKHGVRVRLQGKPFQILCALLQQPGHVVTREELRNKAWSSDTFVDFESGLNTAVNRLRTALGDSAENPIYIETLARLGYRFTAPIEVAPDSTHGAAPGDGVERTHHSAVNLLNLRRSRMLSGLVGVLALAAAVTLLWTFRFSRSEPIFHQITFRNGSVSNARFASGGARIVYGAAWNGAADRLFVASTAATDSREIGFEKAWLASISAGDEMAIFAPARDDKTILEGVYLRGGASRLLSDHAICADWGPNGSLALVTQKDSVYSVEYPPSRKLYNSNGWINDVRVSPRGDKVAFAEHPIFGDDAGQVVVVNSTGQARILSAGWGSVDGVAWHPSGREVWFTAARSGVERALMAVDMNGRTRQVAQVPGGIQLRDISSAGKVLIARTTQHMIMLRGDLSNKVARAAQDISWLDWSHAVAMTSDARDVLFDESGAGGGKRYSVYLYRTGARSPERIGDGRAIDLSSDGLWALTSPVSDAARLSLVSVTSHQERAIEGIGLAYRWAKFFPGGKEILFEVDRAGNAAIYRQRVPSGNPILVKAGVELDSPVFTDTGQFAVGSEGESKIAILNLTTGAARSVETNKRLSPVVFIDEHRILASSFEGKTVVFDFLNFETRQVTLYRRVELSESTGMAEKFPIIVAKDLKTYVYSREQSLSDLFVVSGWS